MQEGIDLPPMNFKTAIELDGAAYKGKIKIPMAGVWATVINVMRGEKTSSTDFYLEVHYGNNMPKLLRPIPAFLISRDYNVVKRLTVL